MSNDNNSNLHKEAVEIELSSYASSAQRNCDPTTVKLELFGNIALVSDVNDLERCRKAIHGVGSSPTKHNTSVVQGIESSSAEYSPLVIQRVESSFAECNISISTKLPIIDDADDIKLCGEAMRKANGHFFKSINVVSKFMEIFDFCEACLIVQIQIIKNSKTKISTRAIAYAKFAMNFFEDGSWRESQWIAKQFTELIEPFLAIKANVTNTRKQLVIALQKIAENWGLLVAESIEQEVTGTEYLCKIASILSIFKDHYQKV